MIAVSLEMSDEPNLIPMQLTTYAVVQELRETAKMSCFGT